MRLETTTRRATLLRTPLLGLITTLALGVTSPALAQEDDEDAIPFEEAHIFFELNNTDGDLGLHALVDGEPWIRLSVEGPAGRETLQIKLKAALRQQGLTELFFESAEPSFDELEPADFFNRFPEGEYEIEGAGLEGETLQSVTELTHLLPAPPEVSVNGTPLPEDCDEEDPPELVGPFVVSWDAITLSHPTLGRTGEAITVDRYEVVVEREEPDPLKLTIDLPPDVTAVELPDGLVGDGEELKVEVLVREESGNQTATESCFATAEG